MSRIKDRQPAGLIVVITLVLILGGSLPGAALAAPQPDSQSLTAQNDQPVQLLRSDTDGVVLEVTAAGLTLDASPAGRGAVPGLATGCQQVALPGFVPGADEGRPALPVKVVLLGAPPGVRVDVVSESLGVSSTIAGTAVCPAPTHTRELSEAGRVVASAETLVADPAVYAEDAFYPSEVVRVTDLGFMRSQRIVRLEIYPLQYNPRSGELRLNRQLRVALRFHGDPAPMAPVQEPTEFENAFRESLLNYETASAWRSSVPAAGAANPWVPPSPAYKVYVKDEGLYQLTRQELSAAGLPVGTLDPRTFKMYSGGQQIAIHVTGQADGKFDEGDALLFYGQGVNTRYTDQNVYWLTYGGAQGLRMAEKASVSASQVPVSHPARARHEQNLTYVSTLPKEPGYDHWYGERIQVAGAGAKTSRTFTLSLPRVASGSHTARLTAQLGGNYEGTHHVRFLVNGNQVFDGKWSGRTLHQATASFTQGYLSPGNNTIVLELINDTPAQTADQILVDWLEIAYERDYTAENDQLLFGMATAGTWLYKLSGFSSEDVEVYDVTDPARVARITGVTSKGRSMVFLPLMLRTSRSALQAGSQDAQASPAIAPLAEKALQFGVTQAGPGRYVALTPAKRGSVLRIEPDASSGVLSSTAPVDYVIISHRDFLGSVGPLATHRASRGLRVKVVDVEEVYDQFGYGLMSAEAIRDFIAYAYSQWPAPAPSHVLLVGDGTFDFRGFTTYGTRTFVPPYLEMVDPDLGETATDNRYVAVAGDDILPDLNIGRLPVNSAAEASAMVDKILAYENLPSAAWMRQVLFVADNPDGGGDFHAYSDGLVGLLPAGYTANKVYLGQTCSSGSQCRSQIIEQINTGRLLVSYIGHAGRNYWAVEKLFDTAALAQINTSGRSPIMVPMTCYEGYFQDPDPAGVSLSEAAVRMAGNGPIASWAPTGYGLAPGHDYLERGLFLALFSDKATLGAAATQGKLYLVANQPGAYVDLIDTFLLLGDTALKVPVQ